MIQGHDHGRIDVRITKLSETFVKEQDVGCNGVTYIIIITLLQVGPLEGVVIPGAVGVPTGVHVEDETAVDFAAHLAEENCCKFCKDSNAHYSKHLHTELTAIHAAQGAVVSDGFDPLDSLSVAHVVDSSQGADAE